MKEWNSFFGTKLNSVLLLILIGLMVFAINLMFKNEPTYLPFLVKDQPTQNTNPTSGILGNKDDLVSFSILPNSKVHGVVSYRGVIKGGYFFEGNIIINILDANKNVVVRSNAVAKDDWMTTGPVSFEGNIDFSKAPKGNAYLEIHNDNASGLPQNDKSVLIPVVIE